MENPFNIQLFKQRAIEVLRGCFLNALLITILSTVLISIITGVMTKLEQLYMYAFSLMGWDQYLNEFHGLQTVAVMITTAAVSFLTSFVITVFAIDPINIGVKKSFMNLRSGSMQLESIGYGFTSNYENIIRVNMLKNLYIFLGTLVIVPGIIFNYKYMLVPYILAENPNMSPRRALYISDKMMMGNKFNCFVMQVSFFGWYFLAMLTCGIGIPFVTEYYLMTELEMYEALRQNAVTRGDVNVMELSGYYVAN